MIEAVTTLISGGQGFFLGAVGQKGLLNKYSDWPHVVMVEEGSYPKSHLDYLEKIGSTVKIVPPIRTQKTKFRATRWPRTFTKLNLWSLTEYEHVLFLDSDAYPYQQIDEFFGQWEPDFLAATTFGPRNPNRFRSGMMVVKPDEDRYNQLLEYVKRDPLEIDAISGDQGVLNRFVIDNFNGEFGKICFHWHTVTWPRRPKNVVIGHVRPKPWAGRPEKLKGYRTSIQPFIDRWKEAKKEIEEQYGEAPVL